VVLIAAGGGEAVARAARSHTGALTTDSAVVKAACRAAGVITVATPAELADVARVLLSPSRPRGRRVAIVSDGGGHGVVATSVAIQSGLAVVPFSDELRGRLTAATDHTAATANPVDLAGAGPAEGSMVRTVETIATSGEVDAILMTGGFGTAELNDEALGVREQEAARAISLAVTEASLSLVVQSVAPSTGASRQFQELGIPVFREIERGLRALGQVAEAAEAADAAQPSGAAGAANATDVADAADAPTVDPPNGDGYFEARRLLTDAGMSFPPARAVDTLAEALAAAQQIGYPVVLKAAALDHKSDSGGVALGLEDEPALRAAYARIRAIVRHGPCSVEAMVSESDAVELVVGCRRDPRFGPVLLVGLGGIYAEVFRDFQLLLAPAAPSAIRRALGSLRGAGLLHGPRGRRPVDLGATCEAAARLSELAAAHPSIADIEVNPLLAHPHGAICLDARIALGAAGEGPA
jgi:acyl-CoA synthetase (NDP forming)